MTSHHISWHDISQLTTWPHVTSQPTTLLHLTRQPKTKQVTTSPPWNGWRLVHSKNSLWASQSLVTLRKIYRQILSLAYRFFSLKLPPKARPALLVPCAHAKMISTKASRCLKKTPLHCFCRKVIRWYNAFWTPGIHSTATGRASSGSSLF